MTPKKDKGGRRVGIPKKTIGFKVPVDIAEKVKEDVRPKVQESILRHQGGEPLADNPKTDKSHTNY